MTNDLDAAKGALDRAIGTFEEQRQQLFRSDGAPKYAPAEHSEREAALFAPIEEAAEAARATAKAVTEAAAQEALLADFDPLLGVDSDRLLAKQSVITPYVETAPLIELARRLKAVAAHGDELDRRLYHLHATKRLRPVGASGGHSSLDGLGRGRETPAPNGYVECAAALRELQATLVDPAAEKRQQAAKRRRLQAEELSIRVMRQLSELDARRQPARAVKSLI